MMADARRVHDPNYIVKSDGLPQWPNNRRNAAANDLRLKQYASLSLSAICQHTGQKE